MRLENAVHRILRAAFGMVLTLGVTVAGCGGKVVFVEGSGGGAGGGGGSTASGGAECVLGVCGDTCTKCAGQTCFTGKCDASSICQPLSTNIACPK